MTSRRRFPPPWSVEEKSDACFIVPDKNGQQLFYFYFENEPGRRVAANLLTKDEARRLAAAHDGFVATRRGEFRCQAPRRATDVGIGLLD